MQLQFQDLLHRLMAFISEHTPSDQQWAPTGIFALVLLVGAVLLIRGGRMLGVVVLGGLGVLGAALGSALAPTFGLPALPLAGVGAVLGIALSFLWRRLWIGLLMAACLTIACWTVYGAQTLENPAIVEFTSRNFDTQSSLVVLPSPGEQVAGTSLLADAVKLWGHASETIPWFQGSVFAIACFAGLAGLVFGFLLPGLASSVWAATAGTAIAGCGAAGLLGLWAPTWIDWLARSPEWAWGILAGAWGVSVILNAYSLRPARRPPAAPAETAQPAVA